MAPRGGTVAIIQARMGSTRFPGKAMALLHGAPIIEHVISRVQRAQEIDTVVLALPVGHAERPLDAIGQAKGCVVVRGPEADVLSRFVLAIRQTMAGWVVRITADCPLIDPALIDEVARLTRWRKALYGSNVFPDRTFPDGLDVEVMPAEMLLLADRCLDWSPAGKDQREHVTPWIRNIAAQCGRVISYTSARPEDGQLRWTVDYPEDLEAIARLAQPGGSDHWRAPLFHVEHV